MKQSSSTFKKPTTEKTIKLDDDYDNERVIIHETDQVSVKKFQSKEFVPNQMSVAASFLSSDWTEREEGALNQCDEGFDWMLQPNPGKVGEGASEDVTQVVFLLFKDPLPKSNSLSKYDKEKMLLQNCTGLKSNPNCICTDGTCSLKHWYQNSQKKYRDTCWKCQLIYYHAIKTAKLKTMTNWLKLRSPKQL